MDIRIGIGYDVHKFAKDRKLIIGGVMIPFDVGLLGHSDADVLVHAIMDSIIGAMGLGDIGKLFPDTDMSYKDVSSLYLLQNVFDILVEKGFSIINVDSIIIAQNPKMSPYINEMQGNISKILKTDLINIKATTEEGLGFTGANLGIAAKSVCLIQRI